MMKKITAAILILVMLFSCACPAAADTSAQQQYEEAKQLLSEGEYDRAGEIFRSLGVFQNAQKYIVYIEALDEAAAGMYALAALNMTSLGEFLDSSLRASYYSARSLEQSEDYESAGDIYVNMPAYLDSMARYNALPEKINAREYAKADRYEKAGRLKDALQAFIDLGYYRDSAERADAVREKINAKAYAAADRLEQEGKLEEAKDAFRALGDYRDSRERVKVIEEKIRGRDYALAVELEKKQEYLSAYTIYIRLKNYKDSAERAALIHDPAKYEEALQLADKGEYKKAQQIFAGLENYSDSAEKAYILGVADFADRLNKPQERVFVFEQNGSYGLVNYEENIVQEALFSSVIDFSDGIARYQYKEKWGLIYTDLHTTSARWDAIENFQTVDGKRFARVRAGELYGYIDSKGNAVIPAQWSRVSGFNSEGVCYVVRNSNRREKGKYYLIGLADIRGNILCEPNWTKLGSADNSDYSINLYSAPATGSQLSIIRSQDGKYGFMDHLGKVVVQPVYAEVKEFSEGLAAVREESKWGYIDTSGQYVIQPQYKQANSFIGGRAEVFVEGKGWIIIGTEDQLIYFVNLKILHAEKLMEQGEYEAAALEYESVLSADPSVKTKAQAAWYKSAENKLKDGKPEEAIEDFKKANGYKDSAKWISKIHYDLAQAALENNDWEKAEAEFGEAGAYADAKDRINEHDYQEGVTLLSGQDYAGALDAFTKAGSYKDSVEKTKEIHYILAESALEAGEWETASAEFTSAGDYKDAAVRIREPYYLKGEKLLAERDYDGAAKAFREAGEYKDSAERITEAYYKQAEASLEAGKWEDATEGFRLAGTYSDAKNRIREAYYGQAEQLLAEGDYDAAADAFVLSDGFGDSGEKLKEIHILKARAMLENGNSKGAYEELARHIQYDEIREMIQKNENLLAAEKELRLEAITTVGEHVMFGACEQDSGLEGKESIEWTVLDVKDGNALLISSYALDEAVYHRNSNYVTWDKSTLRQWLNDTFLNDAFNKGQQAAILTTNVENLIRRTGGKPANGAKTKDKIYLLSDSEALLYYGNATERTCGITAYAGNKGTQGSGTVDWWLRTVYKGDTTYMAYKVTKKGDIIYASEHSPFAVRPVMWVSAEKFAGLEGAVYPVEQRSAEKKRDALSALRGETDDNPYGFTSHFVKNNRVTGEEIKKVISGEAASKAGLRTGDVIVKINGIAIVNDADLAACLRTLKKDDHIQMEVERVGKTILIDYYFN